MRVLVDTNVMLWWLADHPNLEPFRRVIEAPTNTILFSSISTVEVSIKASLGKLSIPDGYVDELLTGGIDELPFSAKHGQTLMTLPWHHRDPFDRMIIAQAICDGLPIATADRAFRAYGVQLV
ncbi:MAG: type II toxin-antitoxin system VapC family toxin [Propionibacteriaceae bacterium]|jgi:PIN domain nuclease of toxin-antitoxin system|nr:type II toxin-antitoxin system VapC family toxin [Propionibacteriaceae bacterium]